MYGLYFKHFLCITEFLLFLLINALVVVVVEHASMTIAARFYETLDWRNDTFLKQVPHRIRNASIYNTKTDITFSKYDQKINAIKTRTTSGDNSVGLSKSIRTTTTSVAPLTHPAKPKMEVCRNPFKKVYDEGKNFLCFHNAGRLGNHMFVYASAFGIAVHTNRTLVVRKGTMISKYFELSSKLVDDYQCVVKDSRSRYARQECAFDEGMFKIPKGYNYCIGLFLQSFKYFESVKDEIKKQFKFKVAVRKMALTVRKNAIETYHKRTNTTNSAGYVLVAVHIRRGDLVSNRHGYKVATYQYIKNATNYFRSKFKNALFLVCSTDMTWSKKHVTGSDVIFIEGNNPVIDMCILTSCDHMVTTVGTFSWWAGYLNPGIKVYYQWPAVENSTLRIQFSRDYSDFFPSDWVGMT